MIDAVGDAVLVVAHVGAASTREAIGLERYWAAAGAVAVSMTRRSTTATRQTR